MIKNFLVTGSRGANLNSYLGTFNKGDTEMLNTVLLFSRAEHRRLFFLLYSLSIVKVINK